MLILKAPSSNTENNLPLCDSSVEVFPESETISESKFSILIEEKGKQNKKVTSSYLNNVVIGTSHPTSVCKEPNAVLNK